MNAIEWILIVAASLGLSAAVWFLWRHRREDRRAALIDRARREFQQRREWHEARFFTLASQSGKPRGLAWTDCDFQADVAYARQRESGQLQAFVAVLVRFQAIEGGDMEDNPNVKNVRTATAVFSYVDDHWDTEGRAVFNLIPTQTIQHFQHELEVVE